MLTKGYSSQTGNKAEMILTVRERNWLNDLGTVCAHQRVIVEKIVNDAVYLRKLGKLNEYFSIQLSPSYRSERTLTAYPDTCRARLLSATSCLVLQCAV